MYKNDLTDYMYVSRRSLSLPNIYITENTNEIVDSLVLPPIFDIKVLLDCLMLKENEINFCNIEINQMFERKNLKKNEKILNFLETNINIIHEKAKEQYENFQKYIKQIGFDEDLLIVDIGWHNSIQKNLINLIGNTGKKNKIYGCYIGVYDDAYKFENPYFAEGYLFNYGSNLNRQYKIFSFVSLLETMFLAKEGTTVGYEEKNKKIIPKTAKYEYDNQNEMVKLVTKFQDGALMFIEDYCNSDISTNKIPADIASSFIIEFGCKMKKEDRGLFENLYFENYKINNIVNFNKSTFYYLVHPKSLKKDFFQSGWRIQFLKKLFKLPLPYTNIFILICKIFNDRRK